MTIRRLALALVAVLLAGAAAFAAHQVAADGGVDLRSARIAGAREGARDGRDKGAKAGYRAGVKAGRGQAFRRARDAAYVRAYRRAFTTRGLPVPACPRAAACRPASR